MTDPSRRDFLRSSLVAFTAALTPFATAQAIAPIKKPKSGGLPPFDPAFDLNAGVRELEKITHPSGWQNFAINDGVIIGFEDAQAHCLARSVTIRYPNELELFRRFPCEISISRLVGPSDCVKELINGLCDITHTHNLYLELPEDHTPTKHPGVKRIGWRLTRPVITSIGCSVSSPAQVASIYGEPGEGELVPDRDRITIAENIQLMCAYVPVQATLHEGEEYVLLPATTHSRYDALTNQPTPPRESIDIGDKDLDAWERAGVDLDDYQA